MEIYIDIDSSKDDDVLVEVNGQGRKYKGQTEQCDNYEIDMEFYAPDIELDQDSNSEYVGSKSSSRPKMPYPDSSKKKQIKKPAASHFTPYPCNYCGKEIIGKGNLESHIKLIHLKTKDRSDKVQTEKSNNSETDMELDAPDVELDQDSDSEYKGSKSSSCPNKQKAPDSLKKKPKWKRASTNVTPYACNYCGKEIIGKWHLESHIKRVHLKTKDSPCQICPKSFSILQHWRVTCCLYTPDCAMIAMNTWLRQSVGLKVLTCPK